MTIEPPHATEPATGPATGPGIARAWNPQPGGPAADTQPLFLTTPAGPTLPDPALTPPSEPAPTHPPTRGPRRRRWLIAVLSALLVVALALAGYLWTTTRGYQQLAVSTEDQARAIGTELATTRSALEGTTAELEGVRAQLATAQARITALADEKAQLGDDREAQRQLVDYQQRVSEAAGTVASALDRCIQGQDQLITYLKDAASYSASDLATFESQVDGLCQNATEANQSLQDELAK